MTVYTRDGCGLCAKAEALAHRESRRAEVVVVDIDRHPDLQRRYNVRVPVVVVDGEEVGEVVVQPGAIRAALRAARRAARRDARTR